MRKSLYILALLIGSSVALTAQTVGDALRYSQISPIGSAAMMGIGSVGGAIGGDYSTMHINPAGLADFSESKFVFTPSISTYNSDAYLDGTVGSTLSDSKSRFGINNLGFVNAGRRGGKLTKSNFAVGFSQMADFNTAYRFDGQTGGSIVDKWAAEANTSGVDNLDRFSTGIAYDAGALFTLEGETTINSDLSLDQVPVDTKIRKTQSVERSGSMNEINITWAGQVDRKLNFGVHVGMPLISYSEQKTYEEYGPGESISAFDKLTYGESLEVSGVGVNFKAGLQYKAHEQVRVGMAIHSPTWFRLTDDFINTVAYSYNSKDTETGVVTLKTASATSPDGNFTYSLTSPWRVVGSLGGVYQLGAVKGFVTGDVEYLDYASSSFNFDDGTVADRQYALELNNEIGDQLTSTTNFRIGTELAYNDVRLRGGMGWTGSPYRDAGEEYSRTYSLGMGFRLDGFFLDVAYRRATAQNGYYPYFDSGAAANPLVQVDQTNNIFAATAGFTF